MVNHTNSQNQWEKYHFSIDKRTQKYYTNNQRGRGDTDEVNGKTKEV